ncbi:ribosomal protein L17 [Rhizopogon vinicolor AM-OR11-026]|uniref:Ribosomal protein L17 n=1 Tax=Rhizopogon vinicolor AM-OR11-026 TaxID=1314800 RepID=A0A1B7NC86_9AGAM|nr:ribosomal protein L17 [Rhizopogon vinicolor AM-OR11-026]
MKHGIAFRKFSRTSSHRNLMLRNLVTSLFEHEQIRTTLAKAKDTARLAEKIITLGKKNNETSYRHAQGFLLKASILPKLFTTFANRYASRPGGYTRIHRLENRTGDNAPIALLELVDNPRDFKLEMTARAVGRELLNEKLRWDSPRGVVNSGVKHAETVVAKELNLGGIDNSELRPTTRRNLQKVMKYRSQEALVEIGSKATAYVETLLAKPIAQVKMQLRADSKDKEKARKRANPNFVDKFPVLPTRAGAAPPGESQSAMRLVQGALARPTRPPKQRSTWRPNTPIKQATYTVETLR